MTKSESLPEEQLVFLALRDTFVGEHVHVREKKQIGRIIQAHKDQVNIQNILRDYRSKNIRRVAKTLLEAKVFESALAARARFPEIFGAPSIEETQAQSEAARSDVATTQYPVEGDQHATLKHTVKLEIVQDNKGDEAGM